MSPRTRALQHTMHQVAIGLHGVFGTGGVSVAKVAKAVGIKTKLMRQILAGDPRVADKVTIRLLADIYFHLEVGVNIEVWRLPQVPEKGDDLS